ncbi:HAMP domain-containing protein [Actinosynnema pretiosum subsp. pretiosum]|uniref:histidine kinase n=1 Tax=Actinosynnema pretiosum subsp. pretiosum TaxID=103721 RepID=A0AA45LDW7_9PSEU|nr:HAMP domain-containing protein [Actinosynnema pretiosum subsp. pretiosum]
MVDRLSLRSRFALLAAAAAALVVVGVAGASWFLVRVRLNQQFDDQLRASAELAARSASAQDALSVLRSDTPQRRGPGGPGGRRSDLVVQFVSGSGEATSAGGPRFPVTQEARGLAEGSRSQVEETEIGRDRYRVWTVAHDGGLVQVARDAEGIEATLRVLGLLHGAVGLVGVLVAAVLGRSVARTALRPVDALTAGAERVARTQDLTARMPVAGRGELARLAEAFNAMLSALAESRSAQRRLVEDAGHELRTPLTSLRANVELLLHAENSGRALPEADRRRLLADLEAQSVELTALVAELVELAKQDREPERFEPVELSDVVAAAVARARARAQHVAVEADLAPVPVLGDAASLERAVLNLLDNAVKWSPPGGVVRVSSQAGEDAVVEVSDAGPGIADEDLPHVFERFYRASAARALPGSGLGLAIVARAAAAHGGAVWAGRSPEGGALLRLTLPLLSHPNTGVLSPSSHEDQAPWGTTATGAGVSRDPGGLPTPDQPGPAQRQESEPR